MKIEVCYPHCGLSNKILQDRDNNTMKTHPKKLSHYKFNKTRRKLDLNQSLKINISNDLA